MDHRLALATACIALALPAAARADAPSTETYREVQLVDEGPTKVPDRRAYKGLFLISPLLIPPGIVLRYHRSLSDKATLVLGGGGAAWKVEGEGPVRFKLLAGVDLTPAGNGMAGFLVGPRVEWGKLVVAEAGGGDDETSMFAGGLILGHRWIWNPGTTLSIGGGAMYHNWSHEGESLLEAIAPAAEFTFGWAF